MRYFLVFLLLFLSSSQFTLTTTATGTKVLNIIDIRGSLLSTHTFTENQITLPTTHLTPGIYILQLSQNNQLITEKLVVE